MRSAHPSAASRDTGERRRRILLGGHRGFGCTDHDFYAARRPIAELPVENTKSSVRMAFARGADFVEIDVVQTADGEVFCLHNVRAEDHVFSPRAFGSLNLLRWQDVKDAQIGRDGTGRICTLSEMLDEIAGHARQSVPYRVNIELKGNQGAGQPRDAGLFFDRVGSILSASPIEPHGVLFSSFCLQDVIEMAWRVPQAQYGVLFQEGSELRQIYESNGGDVRFMYLPFTEKYVSLAKENFQRDVGNRASLSYLHPEVSTMDGMNLRSLAGDGWGFNCWALFEELTEERIALYRRLAGAVSRSGTTLGIITDYVEELRTALDLNNSSSEGLANEAQR